MADIRVRLIIEGEVQGVWFRESTRREAVSLGLSGWVRNRPEGSVEAVVEGPEARVRRLAAWCRKGPPLARVSRVHEERQAWTGEFSGFEIAY